MSNSKSDKSLFMLQIGKYKIGFAPASVIIVFIVLSACAVIAAFHQAKPEYPIPLSRLIVINEGMALLATLVYGISSTSLSQSSID